MESWSRQWTVLACLILVLAAAAAQAGRTREEDVEDRVHSLDSPVQRLTAENFRSLVIESNKAAIVEFYSPRHEMSINIAPIFDVLAVDYGSIMTVGVVNMDKEKELTDFFSHRENKSPFIILFPPEQEEEQGQGRETGPFAGKSFTYYQGQIDASAVAEFALTVLHDRYVVRITEENRQSFHDQPDIPKVFWFSDTNTKPPVIVQAISQAFPNRIKVGYVRRNHTAVFDHYGMPHGQVRLLVIGSNWQMHHYGGPPTASRIFKFIEKYALPHSNAKPKPDAATRSSSRPPRARAADREL